MRPSRKYDEWEELIGKIKMGMAKAEVEQILGSPSGVISTAPAEIIAYREEQIGQSIYSIRVAYTDDRVAQCYLGFEICNAKTSLESQKARNRFLLAAIIIAGVVIFCVLLKMKSH